jgi:hypothetical protein
MSVSRRSFLLATSSTLWLAACGGGGTADDNQNPPPDTEETITWNVAARGPVGHGLSDLYYGNGVLVAHGSNGIGPNADKYRFNSVSYSEDGGQTWTAVRIDIDDYAELTSLSYGSGRFVVVSSHGQVITSTDGKTWETALEAEVRFEIDYPNNFWQVTHGNGVFLIVGGRDHVPSTWMSHDGLSWSEARPAASTLDEYSTRLTYVNGTFYAIGNGQLCTSQGTGETWTSIPLNIEGQSVSLLGLAHGNGTYVTLTQDGFVATSPDFTTWTVRKQLPDEYALSGPWFVNGVFILRSAEKILTSVDGREWTDSGTLNATDSLHSVTFDSTHYVAVGYPGLTIIGTIS